MDGQSPTDSLTPPQDQLSNAVPWPKPAEQPKPSESVTAAVKKWTGKIRNAKKKFESDFDRMRDNMNFVFGIQWSGQEDLSDDRYVANITLREINKSVASLYARNPKACAKRRERLDFTVWDGTPDSLLQAAQTLVSGQINPMAFLVIQDFLRVETERQLIERVARTLETAYAIQLDRQEPNFKLQMKQLVRRVKVCGVGFVRICFKREERVLLTPGQTYEDVPTRVKRLTSLINDYQAKKFTDENAKLEEMRNLVSSLSETVANPAETRETTEKLVFDFPPATSVIVDTNCRMLKGFVGAKWVVQEYVLPLDYVKDFFEARELEVGSGDGNAKAYTTSGEELSSGYSTDVTGTPINVHVCVWELFDKVTQQRMFLCDGYNNYLLPPESLTPKVQRFWHLLPITFNDTETEPGLGASIYPPSDVDLLRHAQLEWNRSRQMAREHRRRNRPATISGPGALTEEDKTLLKSSYPVGSNLEIRGLKDGQKVSDLIQPLPTVPFDINLYTTEPIERDIMLTTGSQQATLGPITKSGTATESSISEQSRLSDVASNVDDLDELLTEMAEVSGEMMLREMSQQSIKEDVGQGAVWPTVDRDKFISRIYLEVAAASTGRPNKGVEIANFERLAPLFLQLIPFLPPVEGGQLISFLIREAVKRLDDRIDVATALPLLNNLKMMLSGGGAQPPAIQAGVTGGAPGGPPSNSAPAPNNVGSPPVPLSAGSDAATAGINNAV